MARRRLEEALPLIPPGDVRMADAFSCRPQSSDSTESPRPPTFVQIRPPAGPGNTSRKLGMSSLGLALAVGLGWAAYRMTDEPDATPDAAVVTQAAPTVADTPSPPQAPADLYAELARRAVDAADSAPAWSRESLMDQVSPFDPAASDRSPSNPPPADASNATHAAGSMEISVRLQKGETIGSELQKLGFAADAVADVVSALAPHVRLKRLPIGLSMTLQLRPSGDEAAKPILQALTLHPEGRRPIRIERDGEGNYEVERR